MSTESVIRRPSEYLATTFSLTIAGTAAMAVFTLPALLTLARSDPDLLTYGIIGVLGFAFMLGQIMWLGQPSDPLEGLSMWTQVLLTIVALAYYNSVILFAGIVGVVIHAFVNPQLAIFAALLYPLWEFETSRYHIPLSVAGLADLIGIILAVAGVMTQEALSTLRGSIDRPLRWIDIRRYGGRRTS